MNNKNVIKNLKKIGLISSNNDAVLYSLFKNKASIHSFKKAKIVLVGTPKTNLFAFYPTKQNDKEALVEAYKMYRRIVDGDMTDFEERKVQHAASEIPTTYSDIS